MHLHKLQVLACRKKEKKGRKIPGLDRKDKVKASICKALLSGRIFVF